MYRYRTGHYSQSKGRSAVRTAFYCNPHFTPSWYPWLMLSKSREYGISMNNSAITAENGFRSVFVRPSSIFYARSRRAWMKLTVFSTAALVSSFSTSNTIICVLAFRNRYTCFIAMIVSSSNRTSRFTDSRLKLSFRLFLSDLLTSISSTPASTTTTISGKLTYLNN